MDAALVDAAALPLNIQVNVVAPNRAYPGACDPKARLIDFTGGWP